MQTNQQGRRDRLNPNQVEVKEEPVAPIEAPEEEAPQVEAAVEEAPQVEEPVEEPKKPDVIGIVSGCERLRVREEANAESTILAMIPVGSEVIVDEDASTNAFYKICNAAGIQGFCMKNYIELRR